MATTFLLGVPEVSASVLENLNPLKPVIEDWEAVKSWFKNLPHNIGIWSIELMAKIYELATSLILKTPLWLFDNSWFKNTTYKFSLLCIGITSILTSVEGIKRMLPKNKKSKSQPMELKDIAKRWFLASGVMTIAPFLFQKAFQGLNWLSEALISMGADNMRSSTLSTNIVPLDVLILVAFDILLISTLVPVLWKNGRKFFDLMILGISAPFALTAWIFDSYRSYYNQWWNHLKHLAMTQVFHALFLLVLGWFIFGVPTPQDFTGFIVKLLVVIGGFSRLHSPPRLISKHLDNDGGFDDVYKKTMSNTQKNFKFAKNLITKNFSALSKDRMSSAKILPIRGEENKRKKK